MKNEWKVRSNSINGQKMYFVYRLRDTSLVDCMGNREYAGEYITDRKTCEAIAKALNENEQEDNHGD